MPKSETFDVLLRVTARNFTRKEAEEEGFNLEEAEAFGDEHYNPESEAIDQSGIAQSIAGAFHEEAVREMLAGSGLMCAIEKVELSPAVAVPDDVIRLVCAARQIAFGGLFDSADSDRIAVIHELDQASEAFASRVPWESEPA